MPPNPQRRNQILDAAIDILCDDGVGGLTHRQVDSRAGMPAGTTSNYFRTRQALLEATAARTVELHWQRVEILQAAIGPLSREALKALMVRMESTRREELRPLMKELQAAAVKSATLIIEAAGFTPSPERMDELSRLLNGFVFSNLTLAPQPGTQDAAGVVDRLLSAFLD